MCEYTANRSGSEFVFGCVIVHWQDWIAIVQAAGRCNRHKERETGKVYIVRMAQDAERLERLYDIRRAQGVSEKFLIILK